MKFRIFFLSTLALFLALITNQSPRPAVASPDAPPNAPSNIACMGWERTTVVIGWKDNSTDETEFRIERSDNGGAWSQIATVAANATEYRNTGVDVSNQGHQYRVRAYRSGDDTNSDYSAVCNNRRIYDPNNFRLFYGLRGTSDACPLIDGREVCLANVNNGGGTNTFVATEESTLQGSADAFFRLGFSIRADQPSNGLDKIPINIVWCDGGGCAGGGGIGLSPMMVETAFNLSTRAGDPIAYLVPLHELWHFLQFKYWGLSDPSDRWIVEGQARSIQDKICIGGNRSTALCFDDIATGDAGYVPEVMGYLSNPNVPITQASYQAALFWTYLTEKYGTEYSGDSTERGMDFMRRFWIDSNANPGRDGITVINSVLASLGETERFRDIWKDFAVANYAKDFNGALIYRYDDMQETGGNYGPVAMKLNEYLSLNEAVIRTGETVYQWGANYYQVIPASDVPFINIKVNQDTTNNLYYTVLGIRGTSIVWEYNLEARNLNYPLLNDSYDKVAIIVAGLENLGGYRLSINGTQPVLNLASPTIGTKARVESQSAPGKFLVQVEVVDGDGIPMAGINLDNFSFRVGTVDVPAGNILGKSQLMGQEWFVLRAPAQVSNDPDGTPYTYELSVSYGSALSDSEDDAVDYTPRNNADNVIILDRSGSMGDYNKLFNAANASKLFIDSWRTNDNFGLVTFNSATTVDMQLSPWSDAPGGSRETAFNLIDGLTAVGGTRIGDSIVAGYNELAARGNSSNDWSLVLLSDGLETDPGTRTFDQAIDYIVKLTAKKPVIHTVAIGPDADRPRMQKAAAATGGTYQYVSAPAKLVLQDQQVQDISSMVLSMDYRYRLIATEVLGYQPFFAYLGPSDPQAGQEVVNIPVESGAAELVLSVSWDGLMGSVYLQDPNGNYVSPFETEYLHKVWRVSTPQGGTWTLTVNEYIIPTGQETEAPAPDYLPSYLVQASLKTDVTMDAFITTPVEDRVPGHPIQVAATLSDNAPITGALVWAAVEKPSGSMVYFYLYDDGAHDDGAADDGVYAGTFYQTGEQGSYNLTVTGYGYSPSLGENFYRYKVLSFHMAFVDVNGDEIFYGDDDADGIPDGWEIFWFGTIWTWGPGDDPDQDSSSNEKEYADGTNPLDPDSDDDGQSDGTDPYPVDPTPGEVVVPWAEAYPGDGQVFIKYSIDPSFQYVGLFRDEDDDLDELYTYIGQHIAPLGGVFTDTAVTNEHEYCYMVAAIDYAGKRSAFSAPTCAVPKGDPLAPHGSVLINDGAPTTASPDVMLSLWATDAVDPEVEFPGSDRFLPTSDSASGVTEMLISNNPDFSGASWEAYGTSKAWTLAQTSGLAAVYVRYRDAAGNETDTYVATIYVGTGPIFTSMFIPMVSK